jgi:hypothetical protein
MPHPAPFHRRLALSFIGMALCAGSLALPAQAGAQDARRAVRVAAQDEPYAFVRGKEGSFNISGAARRPW